MAELVLTDVADDVLRRLQERAASEGRTPAEEAKAILSEALHGKASDAWARADAIYRVTVKCTAQGIAHFKARITSAVLTEPVTKEEPTRIYAD